VRIRNKAFLRRAEAGRRRRGSTVLWYWRLSFGGMAGAHDNDAKPSLACCGYACYGKALSPRARKGHPRDYAYYRCIGSDAYRFGGQRLCFNTQVHTGRLEEAVWQQVCQLLEDSQRLRQEYERRLQAARAVPREAETALVEKQISKLRQGIARLIDGYTEGYIDKGEFEPRIRRLKERLAAMEDQAEQLREHSHLQAQLRFGR